MAGMSLSDYLLAEIREVAERPTLTELRERLHKREPVGVQLETAHGAKRTRSAVIVLDASATVDWMLQTAAGQCIEKRIFSHNELCTLLTS
jgi:hypothetical protein